MSWLSASKHKFFSTWSYRDLRLFVLLLAGLRFINFAKWELPIDCWSPNLSFSKWWPLYNFHLIVLYLIRLFRFICKLTVEIFNFLHTAWGRESRHSALLEKYSVSLKTLLQQGISEPEFYGDLVYRFRKTVGKSNFLEQFRKLINRYKRIGYSLNIMRQTACLVVNPIIVDGYASLFNCTTAVRASDSMTASS